MLLITILETCKALGKSHCNLHPKHNYRQQLKGKSESPKQIMNVCMLRVWGFTLGLGVGLCRWWRLWCGLFSSVKKNASLAALLLPALPCPWLGHLELLSSWTAFTLFFKLLSGQAIKFSNLYRWFPLNT